MERRKLVLKDTVDSINALELELELELLGLKLELELEQLSERTGV